MSETTQDMERRLRSAAKNSREARSDPNDYVPFSEEDVILMDIAADTIAALRQRVEALEAALREVLQQQSTTYEERVKRIEVVATYALNREEGSDE